MILCIKLAHIWDENLLSQKISVTCFLEFLAILNSSRQLGIHNILGEKKERKKKHSFLNDVPLLIDNLSLIFFLFLDEYFANICLLDAKYLRAVDFIQNSTFLAAVPQDHWISMMVESVWWVTIFTNSLLYTSMQKWKPFPLFLSLWLYIMFRIPSPRFEASAEAKSQLCRYVLYIRYIDVQLPPKLNSLTEEQNIFGRKYYRGDNSGYR